MDIFHRLPSLKKLLIEKANLGVCTSATSLPLYSCIMSLSRLYGCYFIKKIIMLFLDRSLIQDVEILLADVGEVADHHNGM